mmetsp:Transcript_133048/g.384851  ORF Transcript_133048/g.384851 Transcript_133048/m.384851 type:complete len:252 (+) Transcript_133048:438-1193(+)
MGGVATLRADQLRHELEGGDVLLGHLEDEAQRPPMLFAWCVATNSVRLAYRLQHVGKIVIAVLWLHRSRLRRLRCNKHPSPAQRRRTWLARALLATHLLHRARLVRGPPPTRAARRGAASMYNAATTIRYLRRLPRRLLAQRRTFRCRVHRAHGPPTRCRRLPLRNTVAAVLATEDMRARRCEHGRLWAAIHALRKGRTAGVAPDGHCGGCSAKHGLKQRDALGSRSDAEVGQPRDRELLEPNPTRQLRRH